MENSWGDDQRYGMKLTSANTLGNHPQAFTGDVTIRRNRFKNVLHLFSLQAATGTGGAVPVDRLVIKDNLEQYCGAQMSVPKASGTVLCMSMTGAFGSVYIYNNTFRPAAQGLDIQSAGTTGYMLLRDNISPAGGNFSYVRGPSGNGATAMTAYCAAYNMDHNLVGANSANTLALYPSNTIVASLTAFGFRDVTTEDYALTTAHLTSSSTGGRPGAPWDTILSETAGVI
jgi:hypothetical protein